MEVTLALLVFLAQSSGSDDSAPDSPQPSQPWMLDVASDGSRVAVARKDGVVELWDPVELNPLEVLEPSLGSTPWAIALSPNGCRLAVLTENGRLSTWNVGATETGEVFLITRGSQQVLPQRDTLVGWRFGAALRWTPDGERLLLVESGEDAFLCAADARVVARWPITRAFAFTRDARHVWTSNCERVESRSTHTGRESRETAAVSSFSTGSEVFSLALHPTRELLVTGHEWSRARVWDLSNGAVLREHFIPDPVFPWLADEVAGAAFSPDGGILALSTCLNSHVFLFDVDSGEEVWRSEFLGAHFGEPLELAWSPDSSRIWFAFECGRGEIGSCALVPDAGMKPYSGPGSLPRMGGAVGLTIAADRDALRVLPVLSRR